MLTKSGCTGTSRRELLWQMGAGFPALALADLLSGDGFFGKHGAHAATPDDTKTIQKKAKSCIFLFMFGGPVRWTCLITNQSCKSGMARVSTTSFGVVRRQRLSCRRVAVVSHVMARVDSGAPMPCHICRSIWTSWRWCIRCIQIPLRMEAPSCK